VNGDNEPHESTVNSNRSGRGMTAVMLISSGEVIVIVVIVAVVVFMFSRRK
jgi:hypothetical protein